MGQIGRSRVSRNSSTEETLTEAGLAASSAKWVPSGSTLVAMYGANAGQVGRLRIDATTNQAVLAVVPDPEYIDSQYLYHSILNAIPSLLRKVQGSGQPNLSGGIVKDHNILVPSRTRQTKIALTAEALRTSLDQLQNQLAGFRAQKRGLMQRLFDGDCHLDERFTEPAVSAHLRAAETI